ncbi:MAG TPA: carboxypeptidase-like regulatory domain-containing protein, partial [Flavobacteriales bacterium]|nr:carboxypeptidase-like regulatory domain-containing protein [Flavobacteriales bacterium]
MKVLKNILIILCTLFCWAGVSNTLFSQESTTEYVVTGHIQGSEGEHLPGASLVALQNPRLGVSTDNFGFYRLTLPSSGPWTLRCSMTGYTLKEIKLDFGNKTTLNLQITLEST